MARKKTSRARSSRSSRRSARSTPRKTASRKSPSRKQSSRRNTKSRRTSSRQQAKPKRKQSISALRHERRQRDRDFFVRKRHKEKVRRYEAFLVEARQNYLEATTGKRPSASTIKRSAEYKKIREELRTKSNAPNGRKARALIKLGLRLPKDKHAVGQTPTNAIPAILRLAIG